MDHVKIMQSPTGHQVYVELMLLQSLPELARCRKLGINRITLDTQIYVLKRQLHPDEVLTLHWGKDPMDVDEQRETAHQAASWLAGRTPYRPSDQWMWALGQ